MSERRIFRVDDGLHVVWQQRRAHETRDGSGGNSDGKLFEMTDEKSWNVMSGG
jgi:hypothetical protein